MALTPSRGADKSVVHVRGTSDCSIMYATLVYKTYAGKESAVTAQDDDAPYDPKTRRNTYDVLIVVPSDAAPGEGQIFADPYCGPKSEFPPSDPQAFEIIRAIAEWQNVPAVITAGQQIGLSLSPCFGPVAAPNAIVELPGTGGMRLRLTRDGVHLRGTVRIPSATPAGAARVMIEASACRGSTAEPQPFRVRRASQLATGVATLPPPHSASTKPTPKASGGTASAVPLPSSTVSAIQPPTTRPDARPTSPQTSPPSRTGYAWGILAAILVAGGAAPWIARHRRKLGA